MPARISYDRIRIPEKHGGLVLCRRTAGTPQIDSRANRTGQAAITVRITAVRGDLAADLAECMWL